MAGSGRNHILFRLARWSAVLVWCGVIFYFSTLPPDDIPSRWSSVAHFGEYAILGWLTAAALTDGRPTHIALALAVVVGSIYGMTDEIHQAFVPGRTPDVADWGVDTLGSLAGALVLSVFVSRYRSRRLRAGRRRVGAP